MNVMSKMKTDKADKNVRVGPTNTEGKVAAEPLSDLAIKDEVEIKGGDLAGQTVRLRIAVVNNEGKL